MTQPLNIVDREFVTNMGLLPAHDIEGLDALYPELFDKTVAAVAARFDGRGVAAGQVDAVRAHVGVLVIEQLFAKLGTRPLDREAMIQERARAAEAWLASAPPVATKPSIMPAYVASRSEFPKS